MPQHTTGAGKTSSHKNNHSFDDAADEFAADTSKVLNELQKGKCPLDVLPANFKKLITELAEKYKFPEDFSLCTSFTLSQ